MGNNQIFKPTSELSSTAALRKRRKLFAPGTPEWQEADDRCKEMAKQNYLKHRKITPKKPLTEYTVRGLENKLKKIPKGTPEWQEMYDVYMEKKKTSPYHRIQKYTIDDIKEMSLKETHTKIKNLSSSDPRYSALQERIAAIELTARIAAIRNMKNVNKIYKKMMLEKDDLLYAEYANRLIELLCAVDLDDALDILKQKQTSTKSTTVKHELNMYKDSTPKPLKSEQPFRYRSWFKAQDAFLYYTIGDGKTLSDAADRAEIAAHDYRILSGGKDAHKIEEYTDYLKQQQKMMKTKHVADFQRLVRPRSL